MEIDMETRCLQIWQVLIACAENRQTIAYSGVTEKLNWDILPYGLGPYLNRVWQYCERESLPDITDLVVNLETGLPGKYAGDPNAKREVVFATDWFALPPPTREDFAWD